MLKVYACVACWFIFYRNRKRLYVELYLSEMINVHFHKVICWVCVQLKATIWSKNIEGMTNITTPQSTEFITEHEYFYINPLQELSKVLVTAFHIHKISLHQSIMVLFLLLSGTQPFVFKIIIMQLRMLTRHNHAVEATTVTFWLREYLRENQSPH